MRARVVARSSLNLVSSLGAVVLCAPLVLVACRERTRADRAAEPNKAPQASASIGPPKPAPPPRRGMVWIEGGALVAGTPPDSLPRIADEEMPGEQVILHGFYIDIYPYPNEEGAIPRTNVTQAEAADLCAEVSKRLCTELEWERACKGPKNSVYEYGERYKADRCGTGAAPALRPSGLRVACASEYGAHDLHGGVWEWTSSAWGRGVERPLGTLRGGNALAGELVGRCANALGRPSESRAESVGFRCCAGDKNEAEVVLHVDRTVKLKFAGLPSTELAQKLVALMPADLEQGFTAETPLKVDRIWDWWPVGNERLILGGGCGGRASQPRCGLVVARSVLGRLTPLGWVPSGEWPAVPKGEGDVREIEVLGGDALGSYRRTLSYVYGSISVGEIERRLPKPAKKKKDKKKKKKGS